MPSNFVGEVSIDIYFGTKFDMINIPYNTDMIAQQALKTLSYTGQVVWQSTWLTEIQINVDDYQDIVGAQYVEMLDTGTSNNGTHWYEVVTYYQISKKCVRLGLAYDPLLTLGIQNISGCSGILLRHSVSDDTHFKYTFSNEPIDQIAPYDFSYYTVDSTADVGLSYNLVGFPYDMSVTPEIIEYTEAPANATIYVPTLEKATNNTHFGTSTGSSGVGSGLSYVNWQTNTAARDNYGNAVALGYDLVSNSYILPAVTNGMITMSTNDNNEYSVITANQQTVSTGFSLYDGSYNNNKASEIGIYFSLYNEYSGDSVTVNNYELNNTSVELHCDPSPNGSFMARFASYMGDTSGKSGLVKSPGYPTFTVTSDLGYGTSQNAINTAIGQSVLSVYRTNQDATLSTQYYNSRSMLEAQRESTETGILGNFITNAVGILGTTQNNTSSLIGAVGSAINAAGTAITQAIQHNTIFPAAADVITANYNTGFMNLLRTVDQQRAALEVQGNIGQSVPPSCKYLGQMTVCNEMYDFKVRKTSLTTTDRLRADRFFTAFGYNVNNALLNSPSQLGTRTRFTFVQANNFRITSFYNSTDLTRVADQQTTEYIANRFSAGVRIWKTEPNFDWSIANPIASN